MKRTAFVLVILLFLAGAGTFISFYKGGDILHVIIGKKAITEGVIEYDITYPKTDPNNMMVAGLPNKAYLHFKNDKVITDMSGMMGLISIAYLSDPATQKVDQKLTLMSKKYVSDIPAEALQQMNDSYIKDVQPGKNKQVIAGYKCKEAIVNLKDGETLHVFYTNDIGIKNPNWANPYNKIDGVLMDFSMERYGLTMRLVAKTVTPQKIEESTFAISDDYKKIPFGELEKMLQELSPPSN